MAGLGLGLCQERGFQAILPHFYFWHPGTRPGRRAKIPLQKERPTSTLDECKNRASSGLPSPFLLPPTSRVSWCPGHLPRSHGPCGKKDRPVQGLIGAGAGMQFQNRVTVLPVVFLRLLDRNQVEGQRLWRFCAAQRLHRATFSKPSFPVSSAYFLQPCATHSMNHPASAPSPAKWIPDAQSRPWTKWGRKTLLRQISRENTIRESKQTWRGGGQTKHPGAPRKPCSPNRGHMGAPTQQRRALSIANQDSCCARG